VLRLAPRPLRNDLARVENARRKFATQIVKSALRATCRSRDVLGGLGYEGSQARCAALDPAESIDTLASLITCLERLVVGETACPIGTIRVAARRRGSSSVLGIAEAFRCRRRGRSRDLRCARRAVALRPPRARPQRRRPRRRRRRRLRADRDHRSRTGSPTASPVLTSHCGADRDRRSSRPATRSATPVASTTTGRLGDGGCDGQLSDRAPAHATVAATPTADPHSERRADP
jgi:hypothetical protein